MYRSLVNVCDIVKGWFMRQSFHFMVRHIHTGSADMVPVSVVCDNSLINQLTKYPEIIYIGSLMAPCSVEYMHFRTN